MNLVSTESKIYSIYSYLREIGVNGQEADSLICDDFRLVEKGNRFVRIMHWLAAKVGLFNPQSEPTYLANVICNLNIYLTGVHQESHIPRHQAEFVRAVLCNIQTRKDPHLALLKRLNQNPTVEEIARYQTLFLQQERVQQNSTLHLPADAVRVIFSHMAPKEVGNLRRVSRVWKWAADSNYCWQRILSPVIQRVFECREPFPYALQVNGAIAKQLQNTNSLSFTFGVFQADRIVDAGNGYVCLYQVNEERIILNRGDQRVVIHGVVDRAFAISKTDLFTVHPQAIRQHNLVTGQVVSHHIQEPFGAIRGVGLHDGRLYICSNNQLFIYDTQEKTLTRAQETALLSPLFFGTVCIERHPSALSNVTYHDLAAPEKGEMVLPNSQGAKTLLVKNRIAYLLRGAASIDLYDLDTQERVDSVNGLYHDVRGAFVEEGILYVHMGTFPGWGSSVVGYNLVTKSWLCYPLLTDQLRTFFVAKQKLFGLNQQNQLREADLLFPTRRSFSLWNLYPSKEQLCDAGLIAMAVAAIAAVISTPMAFYWAYQRESSGQGNLLSKSITVVGDVLFCIIYIAFKIQQGIDAMNGRSRGPPYF